jgi:peptidase C13-like protein
MMARRALPFVLVAALSAVLSLSPYVEAREAGAVPPVAAASAFRFAPSQPGVREAYIVSFGLFGGQSVFESEARGAAGILSQRLAEAQAVVRFNTKRGGTATPAALAAALKAAGQAMDPSKDVLVAALTSHGSPDGLAVNAGRRAGVLSPPMLKHMLDASGARYRVVIVSACYSGVFASELADPRTLVITAASADRPSFGCQDGATWTYFGDAFYNQALRGQASLDAAFAQAKSLVTERERHEGFEPSNPQIAGGAEVLALLARRR